MFKKRSNEKIDRPLKQNNGDKRLGLGTFIHYNDIYEVSTNESTQKFTRDITNHPNDR
jgi:hypothetical protein